MRIKSLAVALGVGLVACLISPHHIRAFAVPPDFANLVLDPSYTSDPAFKWQFYDIFSEGYWNDVNFGKNHAGACAAALLIAGILTFALNITRLRWSFVLTWVGFAALATLRWRLIPFFAIVAVPITVLNLQSWFARLPDRFENDPVAEPVRKTKDDGGGVVVTLQGLMYLESSWPDCSLWHSAAWRWRWPIPVGSTRLRITPLPTGMSPGPWSRTKPIVK